MLAGALLLTVCGGAGPSAAQGPARSGDDPFKNPGALWVTTGRGIACASPEQLEAAQRAVSGGDMSEFQSLSAGCIAPEAGFEVRLIDKGGPGPAKLLLVTGADATGPWFAGPLFFRQTAKP